jgi:AraC family L-rhamnose operon regulatory protein RhaS
MAVQIHAATFIGFRLTLIIEGYNFFRNRLLAEFEQINFMKQPATFRSPKQLFHADTCEPLKKAAEAGAVRVAALGRGTYPGERLPKNDLREICLLGYWDAARDQTWGLDWHRNEGLELSFVEAGQVPFAIEGERSFLLEPGHLTITRPWQRHRVGNPRVPASRYHWLIIDVGVRRPNQSWSWPPWMLYPRRGLQHLTTMLRQNEQPVWRADEEIARCYRKLGKAAGLGATNPETIARLKILNNELIIALAEMLGRRKPRLDGSLSSSERAIRLFLKDLPDRLDEPWTLESMAENCGLGRSRFAAYCRQITNVSPMEYLTRLRLDAAKRLLEKNTQTSITDAAFACGFQSSQYFATVFRQRLGCSPREWRRQISVA